MSKKSRKLSFEDFNTCQVKRKKFTNSLELLKPTTKNDLPVAKSKIEEIETWLKTFNNILLISGPSGCCKKSTLELLCKLLNVDINKWREPIDHAIETYHLADGTNQKQTFHDFLKRSSRYSSLINHKRLTVIDEFPNYFHLNPNELSPFLLNVLHETRHPFVFIMTMSNTNDCQEFFSNDVINLLKIKHVHLNPIHKTNMKKAVERIIRLFSSSMNLKINLNVDEIESICELANGDIRYASNLIHYTSLDQTKSTSNIKTDLVLKKYSKKKKETDDKPKEYNSNFSKNIHIGLFRGIGKILHPKRTPENTGEIKLGNPEGILVYDPEKIVDEFSSMANGFVSIVQENYIKIFSDINNIANAAEYISYFDIFQDQWKDNNLREEALSLTIRGVLNYNIKPKRIFLPMKRSQLKDILFDRNKNLNIIRTSFNEYNCSMNTFHCEMIPYLAKLKHGIQNYAQAEYISKYGSFNKEMILDVNKYKVNELSNQNAQLDDENIHISDFSDED